MPTLAVERLGIELSDEASAEKRDAVSVLRHETGEIGSAGEAGVLRGRAFAWKNARTPSRVLPHPNRLHFLKPFSSLYREMCRQIKCNA